MTTYTATPGTARTGEACPRHENPPSGWRPDEGRVGSGNHSATVGNYSTPPHGTQDRPLPDAPRADWATYYRGLGMALCAVPLGTKGPTMAGWPEHNLSPAHWEAHPGDGIGAVLGPSRLVSLDLDALPESRALLAALGLDLDTLTAGACLVRGNPARLRALFRAPDGAKLATHKLAWPPREPGRHPVTVFELRAGPVQDCLPPTIHPGTGKPYTWDRAPWELEGRLAELPPELLELWIGWDAWKPALVALCPWAPTPEPKPKPRAPDAGLSVIAAWNHAHDVREILEAHGYRPKGKSRWVAPCSESKLPGVVLLPETGRIFSHHGADPLANGHGLDCFEVYSLLEHGGDTRAAVRAAAEILGMSATPRGKPRDESGPWCDTGETPEAEWPEPATLPGLPEVPAFEPGLLPAAFRPWLMDVAERIQCPPDFPAVGALVALAAVVGRQVAIRPKRRDDWTVVPNLWGAAVGRPGVLKTSALTEPMRPLVRLEGLARVAHEEAMRDFEAAALVAEQRRAVGKEEIRKALKARRDPGPLAREALGESETPPARVRYTTSDASVEKLGELLRDNARGVLVYRDELTGLLRSLDREGNETARAFYLESWNGTGGFTFDRIGRGTVEIEAACVSILGGIQPGPLGEYLRAAVAGGAGDDGLLQRFQLVAWPDIGGEWRNIDRWPDSGARDRAWAVFERLNTLDPGALGAERDGDGPPFLRFDGDAQELFTEWRGGLERRLRAGEEAPAFEAHLSKFRSLVPSLALLLHLADHEAGPVGEPALLAACAWAEYLEGHARRLYAPAVGLDMAAAGELVRHLKRGDLGDSFTLRELVRKGWRGLDSGGAPRILETLAELGWVRGRPVVTGGRPTVLWTVNPAAGRAGP